MTSEFDPRNTVLPDGEDEEDDDFGEGNGFSHEDFAELNVSLLKEPGEVISGFLSDFTESYDRGFQGPIPIPVLQNFDRLSGLFKSALLWPNQAGYISLELSYVDLAELGGLVYFAACGGEEEIVLGEKSHEPHGRPLDLAILDLNEAFVRVGGKDNPGLRKTFEGLGKEEVG